jgi:hypothetical protein
VSSFLAKNVLERNFVNHSNATFPYTFSVIYHSHLKQRMMGRFRWRNEKKKDFGWKERKEGEECAMRREGEAIEHLWNGCSEMREEYVGNEERGKILNEDRREIRWMKENERGGKE